MCLSLEPLQLFMSKFELKYNPECPHQWIVWRDCSALLYSQSLTVTAVSLLSQIAGMAFSSTGNCSFQCTPRHGMVGNQCTALIKTLTSCLHRKLTCLLLISCRFHSVSVRLFCQSQHVYQWQQAQECDLISRWDWIKLCDKCSE